jgi:hypothetical protein
MVSPALAEFQQLDRRRADIQANQGWLLFSEEAQNSPFNILKLRAKYTNLH